MPLTKMPEQQMESTRHKGWVIVHGQVEEHAKEHATTIVIQVQSRSATLLAILI